MKPDKTSCHAVGILLTVAVFLAGSFPSRASERPEGRGGDFSFRRYEISVGGGVYPGRAAFGYNTYSGYLFYPVGIGNIYEASRYYEKERTSGSWTAAFTFNFTKVMALGASLSYEGGWSGLYRRSDGTKVTGCADNYISPLLTLRVSWLNRPLVRMYSSVGGGVAVNLTREATLEEGKRLPVESDVTFSFQVTPIGISVGRKLFGFAEAGIGHQYVGGFFGIGYRFN